MRRNWKHVIAGFWAITLLVGLLSSCEKKADVEGIQSVMQLNDPAYTIGVQTGAVSVSMVETYLPQAKMKFFNSIPDAYLAVRQGKVDGFAFDRMLLTWEIANGLEDVKILQETVGESADVAVGISPKTKIPNLEQEINAFLAEMKAQGVLDDMLTRWVEQADEVMPDIPKAQNPTITLKVGTSGVVPPFNYYKDNTLTGYDVEMIYRLGAYMNADVDIRVYDYAGLAAAAESGNIDCIMANLNATEERRQTLAFSTALFPSETAILVRDLEGSDTKTIDAETARYGIMTGAAGEDYIQKAYPNATIHTYVSIADAFLALGKGKIDYVLTSYTTALSGIAAHEGLEISKMDVVQTDVSIALSKENPELLQQLDEVLAKFKADGTLDKIIANWTTVGQAYPTEKVPVSDGKNGTLRVAISADREPMCFVMDGTYRGLDCELIERMAYELGMNVTYQNMQFSGLISALTANKADLIISNMTNTEERRQAVNFTAPYFDNPQVLVGQKTNPDTSRTLTPEYTDLSQLSGKKISSLTGSAFDSKIRALIPDANISYFNSTTDEVAALKSGKVAATPTDEPVAKLYMAKNSDLTIIPNVMIPDEYGVALTKGSPLTAEFNAAIATLEKEGILDQMEKKWMGADADAKVLPELPNSGANGVLQVGCGPELEPMCYVGNNGAIIGYDAELMLRIGAILGKTVNFVPADIAAHLPMLQSGKVDALISCMSITEERTQQVDMTDPYYVGGMVILVRSVEGATEDFNFFERLKASFIRTFVTENRWKLVLNGLGVTILLSVCSGVLGSALGFGICMLRRSKSRLCSGLAGAFIRLIQGTPIVVLLMILYYIVLGGLDVSAILVAILSFSINFAVYVSEMMRTGIEAVDKGQMEAAQALGFTKGQTFWKIIFPQAARHFLPVFKGEFISMVKMTSVVGYIAIQDLTKVSDIIRSRTLEAFFPLIATAIIYFMVASVMMAILSRIEVKLDPKRRARTVKGVVMK